jgi:hypothetical protein
VTERAAGGLATGAGVMLVVCLWLPWYRGSSGTALASFEYSAWTTYGTADIVLAIVGVAAALTGLTGLLVALPRLAWASLVIDGVAGFAGLIAEEPRFDFVHPAFGRSIGFSALLGVIAAALLGALSRRERTPDRLTAEPPRD